VENKWRAGSTPGSTAKLHRLRKTEEVQERELEREILDYVGRCVGRSGSRLEVSYISSILRKEQAPIASLRSSVTPVIESWSRLITRKPKRGFSKQGPIRNNSEGILMIQLNIRLAVPFNPEFRPPPATRYAMLRIQPDEKVTLITIWPAGKLRGHCVRVESKGILVQPSCGEGLVRLRRVNGHAEAAARRMETS